MMKRRDEKRNHLAPSRRLRKKRENQNEVRQSIKPNPTSKSSTWSNGLLFISCHELNINSISMSAVCMCVCVCFPVLLYFILCNFPLDILIPTNENVSKEDDFNVFLIGSAISSSSFSTVQYEIYTKVTSKQHTHTHLHQNVNVLLYLWLSFCSSFSFFSFFVCCFL